jgi:small glutamine-rich tetratricopeptide repeat-containing protein alpha
MDGNYKSFEKQNNKKYLFYFSYSKAYGRMGLAYSSVEKHKEAVDCFKKAIEIEPDNESYKSNLKLAEDRLKSVGSPGQSKETPFCENLIILD